MTSSPGSTESCLAWAGSRRSRPLPPVRQDRGDRLSAHGDPAAPANDRGDGNDPRDLREPRGDAFGRREVGPAGRRDEDVGRLFGEPREDVGLGTREKGEGDDERRHTEDEPDERRRRDDPDLRVPREARR